MLDVFEFLFVAPVAALLDHDAGAFEFFFVAEKADAVKMVSVASCSNHRS